MEFTAKKYSAEDRLEAAQCVWEAVGTMRDDENIRAAFKAKGTAELRGAMRDNNILDACVQGWVMLSAEGVEVDGITDTFDWDYTPWFVKNCIDWPTATLKKNWHYAVVKVIVSDQEENK